MTVAVAAGNARREWRKRLARCTRLLRPVLPAVVLLGGWELGAVYLFDASLFGQPSAIIERCIRYAGETRIWYDAWVTFSEIVAGYAIGMVVGGLLGYLVAISDGIARVVEPYVLILNAVPKVAIAPLLIVIFGIGMASKVAIVASMVFFLMFYAVFVGLRTIEADFIYQARIMGVSRLGEIRFVVLPAIMPNVLVGMKSSAASAVIGAVIGEIIAAQAGLGYFILDASGAFNVNDVWVGVIYLMLLLFVMTGVIGAIERHVLRWLPKRRIG